MIQNYIHPSTTLRVTVSLSVIEGWFNKNNFDNKTKIP